MVRVGPDHNDEALKQPHTRPMDFTGTAMAGYIYVSPAGIEEDLNDVQDQLLGPAALVLAESEVEHPEVTPEEDQIVEPTSAEQRALLDRYVDAFERKDVQAIVKLFTADAVWEMPPFTGCRGRAARWSRKSKRRSPIAPGRRV